MLDKKEIKKTNQELVDLHKRCITTSFAQRSVKFKTRKKFFKLYDMFISHKNIRLYFFRDLDLFILALVKDRLSDITDYFYGEYSKDRLVNKSTNIKNGKGKKPGKGKKRT